MDQTYKSLHEYVFCFHYFINTFKTFSCVSFGDVIQINMMDKIVYIWSTLSFLFV